MNDLMNTPWDTSNNPIVPIVHFYYHIDLAKMQWPIELLAHITHDLNENEIYL